MNETPGNHPSVTEIEHRFLNTLVWLLPPALALLTPLIRSTIWVFMALSPEAALVMSLKATLFYGVAGFVAGLVMVGMWRLGLKFSQHSLSGRLSLAMAVILCVIAEGVVRKPYVEDMLWGGVRVRAQENADFFLRETALFRRLALRNDPSGKPRVMTFGSSQLIIGVDHDLLQELLPHRQIERRCIAAMSVIRMLMTEPMLGVRSNDTIIVYWSEFDMGGLGTVDTSWYRPLANTDGLRALQTTMPPQARWRSWRGLLELHWATASELWRSRDAWRTLLLHSLGKDTQPPAQISQSAVSPEVEVSSEVWDPRILSQKENYRQKLASPTEFARSLAAAEHLLRRWGEIGADVIVLEGSLNPAMQVDLTGERRLQTRQVLSRAAREAGAKFIPVFEQGYQPGPGDWKDGTHLNEAGREYFTHYLGELIKTTE